MVEHRKSAAHDFKGDRRQQKPDCGSHARIPGDDDPVDAEFAGHRDCMQRRAAAESNQRAFGHIQSFFNGMNARCAGHVFVNDFYDCLGASRRIGFQCITHGCLNDLLCRRRIKRYVPARESIGIQPAQHEVGIGHRRTLAAAAVACRPGFSAGALRPHGDPAEFIDARQ